MRRLACAAWIAVTSACGSSGSPSSPTQTPASTPTPASVTVIATITDTVSGMSLGTATADVPQLPASLTVSGTGYVTRTFWATTVRPTVDLIPDAPPFSLAFYRQLVRNGHEAPEALQPLRRWTRPPLIYLKTVDEAGVAVSAAQLDSTEQALIHTAHSYTGGRFGLGGLERGTGTREGQSGWVTVKWLGQGSENLCGRATIAQDGGYIELNYLRGAGCACGSLGTRPRTVRHELGHAFGYFHTDSTTDIMNGTGVQGCDALPSERELYHAAIAYVRPAGSRDVDVDPAGSSSTMTTRAARPLVIVD